MADTIPQQKRRPLKPGMTIGRLTVLEDGLGETVRCECTACGRIADLNRRKVVARSIHTCGCAPRSKQPSHGLMDLPEYTVWKNMRSRCNDPRQKSWPDYGGRGIRVDQRWEDFAQFYADMGPRPSAKHEIDRRDNNGPYSQENCRWSTRSEQGANRRNNVMVSVAGERVHLAEACRRLGLPKATVMRRIQKGATPQEAIDRKSRQARNRP